LNAASSSLRIACALAWLAATIAVTTPPALAGQAGRPAQQLKGLLGVTAIGRDKALLHHRPRFQDVVLGFLGGALRGVEPGTRPGLILIGKNSDQGRKLRTHTAQPPLEGDRLAVLDQLADRMEAFQDRSEQQRGPGLLVVDHVARGRRLVVVQLVLIHRRGSQRAGHGQRFGAKQLEQLAAENGARDGGARAKRLASVPDDHLWRDRPWQGGG
jgi:hypothetical protein